MRVLFVLFLSNLLFLPAFGQAPVQAFAQAHAHNDYAHERPLFDALDQGFTSVEADVFLIDGELYVYHNFPQNLDSSRTLRRLYLEPLYERFQTMGGRIYPDYEAPFFLMIDIKRNGEAVYAVLKEQLAAFLPMLTQYEGTEVEAGAVLVFLSGNRPKKQLMAEQRRIMALDGRPADLGKGIHPSYMPVISDHYGRHLSWNGQGPIPEKDWKTMTELTQRTHAEGKKLRFWASPEKTAVWEKLYQAGVDLINTDQLEALKLFLRQQK